jgi:hypothetical protein
MPHWSLSFEGPVSWDELTRALGAAVDALTGQRAPWVDPGREALDDPNGPTGNAFRHALTRPEATLALAQEAGEGNPRDGYGYHRSVVLTVATPGVLLQARESGYEGGFRRLDLHFEAPRAEDVDTIRGALRGVLGPARDRSAAASLAARNIAVALPFDEARARRWLAEGKAQGPQAYGWRELLALAAELEGSTPALLTQRLREAPHDVAAWREATPETSGLAAEVLTEVRWRFEAPAPTDGWRRLEDGLGPIGGRMGLSGRLDSALWGEALPQESGLVRTADASGATQRGLRAAWAGGELPRMGVEELDAVQGERTTTLHLWDDTAGDRVVLRWVITDKKPTALHLGYAAAAEGSAAFQARAWAALETLSPGRWEPTPADALFAERAPRHNAFVSRALPRRERVLATLALTGDDLLPELTEILRACACDEPYCPHARRLIDLERTAERAVSAATLWADLCVQATRAAALDAAVALLQGRPDSVDYALARAEHHWATHESLRPGVALSDTVG